MNKTKILILATEMSPFASSGGLGEVIGSLPKSLHEKDIDVRIVLPKHKSISEEHFSDLNKPICLHINLGHMNKDVKVYTKKYCGFTVYFIENSEYSNRDSLYGYPDDFERYAFFSKAALEILPSIDFKPDLIHLNDWQTALCPVYLDRYFSKFTFYKDIKTLITIHNIQYQGIYSPSVLEKIGLDYSYFTIDKLEYFGNINLLKGGLLYSNAISTVSPTYAKEIQSSDFAYGLEGILQQRKADITGILNGVKIIDKNEIFDQNFEDILAKKKETKSKLQKQLGLEVRDDVPMIAVISRLVSQKGLSLINHEFFERDIQLVILGTGEGGFENYFRNIHEMMPEKVSANIFYKPDFANDLYLASDLFLMPSLFEPCGLGQIFALEHGTIPIVRSTGGLKDTISHYDVNTQKGNGFVFEHYLSSGLLWALDEAIILYKDKRHWNLLMQNALNSNFSWDKSSDKYIELYNKIINVENKVKPEL
ncbi:MAG: glycogen synthase [Lachnospirales bacterium]